VIGEIDILVVYDKKDSTFFRPTFKVI